MKNLVSDGRSESNLFHNFRVGDPVNWNAGTDCEPGTVSRIMPGAIFVRPVKAVLLNGADSGEPDALTFQPGGFVGHTSGTQRHRFEDIPNAPEIKFTKRSAGCAKGKAKQVGTSTRGSMRAWGILRHGHISHYDFNF